MRVCAVIPAAGRGLRLGLDRPKIFAPLSETETIWSVMRGKLLQICDHVHLVASPDGEPVFREVLDEDLTAGRVSLSIQPSAIGMGDAIFRGYSVWSQASIVLVIWGDQVFVSHDTLSRAVAAHGGAARRAILPIVAMPQPYVEFVFGPAGDLITVRQSREGDICAPGGYNDVGTFVLSVSGLMEQWQTYLASAEQGKQTNEVNFLPFLPFLARRGWDVRRLDVSDPREARGVNSPDDLAFFQELQRSGE